MTEKEGKQAHRPFGFAQDTLTPVLPGGWAALPSSGQAGSRRKPEQGERPGQKRRRGWPWRHYKTKFVNWSGLLGFFGSFLVGLLGFLCHADLLPSLKRLLPGHAKRWIAIVPAATRIRVAAVGVKKFQCLEVKNRAGVRKKIRAAVRVRRLRGKSLCRVPVEAYWGGSVKVPL